MIRVVIADDHAIVREGIKRTLADAGDIEVVGEADDGQSLLSLLSADAVDADLALIDLSMPGMPGLDLLQTMRRRNPGLPVLVLSMYPTEQYAARTIRGGARGYINKARPPAELVAAIRAVASGRHYIDPEAAKSLATQLDDVAARPPHERLSNREYEVMRLIAQGKSIGDVAGQLLLSVKTVSTYRRRVLDKLGLRHNAALTRYAIQNALVD